MRRDVGESASSWLVAQSQDPLMVGLTITGAALIMAWEASGMALRSLRWAVSTVRRL